MSMKPGWWNGKYGSLLIHGMVWTLMMVTAIPGAWGETAGARSEDPLIRLLIQKGILTEPEAAGITKEMARMDGKDREGSGPVLPDRLSGLKIGMLGYIDYSSGEEALTDGRSEGFNRFTLTRGYFTVKKKIRPWMGVRMTTDIHQDATEDWKIRLKYLYVELKPLDFGFLTNMKLEAGQGHIPWLDFEEHINPYRAQGPMAIERSGIFNSADVGVSLRGNFGGRIRNAAALTGNRHYDGRYGSWHVGVYNGGGYHATERNNNKVLEGRFTLRPLPAMLPGLQVSYFGIYGNGNRAPSAGSVPRYRVNLGMLSWEHPLGIVTAQYFRTRGNAAGTLVDAANRSLDTSGYSFFGRAKLPIWRDRLALFGRYDHFNPDRNGLISRRASYNLSDAGLSLNLDKGNMILVTYESTDYEPDSNGRGKVPVPDIRLGDEHRIQMVYQLAF